MSIYVGIFENKSDVESNFNCGEAFVLFVEDNRLYEVHGSHCSCYGLEGQWEPEETLLEALQHRIQYGNLNNQLAGYGQEVLDQIAQLGLK